MEDVNNPGRTAIATCTSGGSTSECTKVSTKYLATVQLADDGAPEGATHKLETGTVPLGLYRIKLWGFNDVTPDGTPSTPSAAVATFGELLLAKWCRISCVHPCAAAVSCCQATSCCRNLTQLFRANPWCRHTRHAHKCGGGAEF